MKDVIQLLWEDVCGNGSSISMLCVSQLVGTVCFSGAGSFAGVSRISSFIDSFFKCTLSFRGLKKHFPREPNSYSSQHYFICQTFCWLSPLTCRGQINRAVWENQHLMLICMLVLYYLGEREGLEGFTCSSCLNCSILHFRTLKGFNSWFHREQF